MWMGSGQYQLAPALVELIQQLQTAFPARAWQTSPQTGTIGDAAHLAQGSASDHNPWLNNTVRALDVAANTPGGPDAEALFQMVNRMFAGRDGRVWPNGYAIFNGRITDWDRPGEFHTQQGDPHLYHVHISVSQNPSGYESIAPWPIAPPSAAGDALDATQNQTLNDIHAMLARLSFGLDNGGPFPFSQRGELTDRIRTIDGNCIAQPPSADQVAGAVATKIPPFPVPPTADAIGQAAAQHVAASNVEAIVAGILAQLPAQPTKEQIAQATRAELAANPLKLS